jgi:hypothetical protein
MSAVLAPVKWMSLSKILAIRSGQLIESKKVISGCLTIMLLLFGQLQIIATGTVA